MPEPCFVNPERNPFRLQERSSLAGDIPEPPPEDWNGSAFLTKVEAGGRVHLMPLIEYSNRQIALKGHE